jgi:protein-tyrosine kinase
MKMYVANQSSDNIINNNEHETESVYDLISVEGNLVPSQCLDIAHGVRDQRSEKILALRTELLLRRTSSDHAYMIAMISPCNGEGRSQLAAELAIAFARMNRPTLLVDTDFRNPQQHVLFNADNSSGGLVQAIESDRIPDLHGVENLPQLVLITAGLIPSNPLELLSSEKFAQIIEYMRDNFEYIIFDTPPTAKYSDGMIIANLVGNVLSLSRANHTSHRHMRDMLRGLSITNSRILGGVLNRF